MLIKIDRLEGKAVTRDSPDTTFACWNCSGANFVFQFSQGRVQRISFLVILATFSSQFINEVLLTG